MNLLSYDSKKNFKLLTDKNIDPVIKVRKNSSFKTKGCMARKLDSIKQIGNLEWKKEKGYGYRWMVE